LVSKSKESDFVKQPKENDKIARRKLFFSNDQSNAHGHRRSCHRNSTGMRTHRAQRLQPLISLPEIEEFDKKFERVYGRAGENVSVFVFLFSSVLLPSPSESYSSHRTIFVTAQQMQWQAALSNMVGGMATSTADRVFGSVFRKAALSEMRANF